MGTRANRRFGRVALFGATAVALAGCAPATSGSSSTSPSPSANTSGAPTQTRGWRVTTKEHVDLWLHGFALLTSDTGHVPFFARGYKQQITALKRQRNIFTQLDANQQDLSRRFATNPSLTNAQFLAMYFNSFAEIVEATDFLARSQGNPRASSNPDVQQRIAFLAANFPTQADRDWARRFVEALQDENNRFYHDYWTKEQQTRGGAFAQFNQEWTAKYYPKLSRFLTNTQQPSGELLLSLPVGGEGRTINDGKQANAIAVLFPRTPDASAEALYVFCHEIVARLVDEAIRDNTTPAEQRTGAPVGYVGNGAVRGGALLLQRVAPDLVPGYMRFYLQTLGMAAPTGDPSTQFAAAFPLPAPIVAALGRSIESVLGGI
jgi:hypothetical protein